MIRLSRTAGIMIALAIVLSASGCVGTVTTDATPTPTPTFTAGPATATVPPTAVPTPEPTNTTPASTPTPDAGPVYEPGDPGTWTIDFTGIGPIILGRPMGELPTVVPFPTESCRPGVLLWSEHGLVASGRDSDTASVSLARVGAGPEGVLDPTPSTEAGIHVGSTLAELQAAYPDLEHYPTVNNSESYRITDGSAYIHFTEYGTGVVNAIEVTADEVAPKEYCG